MLPELDWDDTERTLVREESTARPAREGHPRPAAGRTIPIEEQPISVGPSWKKSTVRMPEPAPVARVTQIPAATGSDRVVTLVDEQRAITRVDELPAGLAHPVWDDETMVTDVERVVEHAPDSDRRALQRVLRPRRSQPIEDVVPAAPVTLPIAADALDPEDYDTIAFERDPGTGELRPVETGVRLKRAGVPIDFRRTVVGMAPPSHLLAAIEEAERRAAERRTQKQPVKQEAKQQEAQPKAEERRRPKAMAVDDSIDVLPVIGVAPHAAPVAQPAPAIPPPVDTQAMTVWQPQPDIQPTPYTPPQHHSSYPPPAYSSQPPPAYSSQPPPAAPAPVWPAAHRDQEITINSVRPFDLDAIAMAEQIRRRSRARSIVAAVVCLLLVFAAVVGGVLHLRTDGATVRIHVQSQNGGELPLADIYLDGDKVCEASPCVLREVKPGTRKLRVEAPGHTPVEQTVAVDKGQDRLLAVTINRHGG